jgi:hypothetical protein
MTEPVDPGRAIAHGPPALTKMVSACPTESHNPKTSPRSGRVALGESHERKNATLLPRHALSRADTLPDVTRDLSMGCAVMHPRDPLESDSTNNPFSA